MESFQSHRERTSTRDDSQQVMAYKECSDEIEVSEAEDDMRKTGSWVFISVPASRSQKDIINSSICGLHSGANETLPEPNL